MTAAQTEAAEKAWDILKEHFTSAVLIMETEMEATPVSTLADHMNACHAWYHGGWPTAVGLVEVAKRKLLEEDEV